MDKRDTIRMEPDMLEKLNEISSETGKSISELVRDAIRWSLLGVATVQIPKEEVLD
ncbi:MAG: ribbon-helix-helix protein, CopG family [Candidatus Micrarchaeota archaeon]